ncbi:MAG: methyltransferase domain-containing protein [Bacteroidales bacterium]|nr:methyltransferase domain-containing protein [Bacteroidales bacterium]
MEKRDLIRTGASFDKYYSSLNKSYHKAFNKYLMLHYPFFNKKGESLEQRQINLTDFCVSRLEQIQNRKVLEIGCGNGTQSLYIAEKYGPAHTIGIDLNVQNIELAHLLNRNADKVSFFVDDAHALDNVEDNSIDIIFCIESAFHYPEKDKFLKQVNRVLKDGGEFVIADILAKSLKKRPLIRKWKQKMFYFHWTMDQYMNSFRDSQLTITKTDNITPNIIRGYRGYLKWIKRKEIGSYMFYSSILVFVFIQVNLNLILLRRRRHYMVFTGKKMAA